MKTAADAVPARAGVGLRAYFLRGAAVLLLASAAAMAACMRPSRLNIIVIVVDTLRADRLMARSGDSALMPVLDELARESCFYEAATSAAPMTMPSMASLFSGLYPDRSGVVTHSRRTSLAAPSATMAELAREAGYTTAAVVANPWLASPATRFHRGFDRYLTKRQLSSGRTRLDAHTVTDAAIAELDRARSPVFLWVHYIDTHMPYQPPLADAQALHNPSGSSAIVRDYVDESADRQAIYFAPPYSAAEIDATRRLYDAAARAVDREIGRLLEAIDRTLGRDRTLVVFTADHGESLGEHGLYFAHDFTLYQELIHVPLMIRGPGIVASRVSTPVSLVDVLPTVCVRSGLACPRGLDGAPLPSHDEDASAAPVFAIGPPYRERYSRNPYIRVRGLAGRWAAMRVGRNKLVRVPEADGVRWESYRLGVDADETQNVFDADVDAARAHTLEAWLTAQASGGRPRLPADRRNWTADDLRDLRALGYLD